VQFTLTFDKILFLLPFHYLK